MTAAGWLLDGALAVALPVLGWRAIAAAELRTSIVLFVALGLLSSLAWIRLDAPDVALVEAAVGAGLTGALLMSALGWAREPATAAAAAPRRARRIARHLVAAALLAVIGGLLAAVAWTILAQPAHAGLGAAVREGQARTGVSHPVTAVLLDMRGYDTLLEVGVLVVVAFAIAVIRRPVATRLGPVRGGVGAVGTLGRVLAPGFVLVAGYLVWKGSSAPGGAFQAAAVLAAGLVLLALDRVAAPLDPRGLAVRLGTVAGLVGFLVVAAAPLIAGVGLLVYPAGWGGTVILALESLLSVAIALALAIFVPPWLAIEEPRR